MLGSSRTSLLLVMEAVDAAFDDPDLARAGTDLLAITDLRTPDARSPIGALSWRASSATRSRHWPCP
jgi:hypothetical protein